MAISLKERPIIMIGPERSGTTLVMAMLGNHPRIAVPEVVWYYSRFRPYLHTYGDLSKKENLYTLATEMVHGLKTPYWGMSVNPRTIVDEIVASAHEQSFAGIYCAMFERYAKETGDKPRWGEKTPYNLFFVGSILKDFPNAQFIHITRDGRDASADYLESSFGPTNIYSAAKVWKMCMNAVKPWREKLAADQWFDIRYEELVREPEKILRDTCAFLGEDYSQQMMEFHTSDIAVARGKTRDHKPLGSPVSDKYIGIYKDLLSLRDQRIFAAVAGSEMLEAGYDLDVEPEMPSAEMREKFEEWDGRIRAATLDGFEGHIVYESYNDWLVDQREERKRRGLWTDLDAPLNVYPLGTPEEELVMGQRAWRKWKTHFSIKRDYNGKLAL
ncbi:MAG: protein-tyrosine sulfotransferase [Desulfobulbaceae bacterium BRH_c16a]|nr:MAG: protein-tyrosine sulfotransferase [Desulfobulbaceae bacterium BRH_c16a]